MARQHRQQRRWKTGSLLMEHDGSRTDCHAFHVSGVVQGMNTEEENRLLDLHSQI